jgi:hypothetical protein
VQRLVVIAPMQQIAIDGGCLEHRLLCLNELVWYFDAELFEKPDRFSGGQMPSFLVRCPNLEGSDEFPVILYIVLRQVVLSESPLQKGPRSSNFGSHFIFRPAQARVRRPNFGGIWRKCP